MEKLETWKVIAKEIDKQIKEVKKKGVSWRKVKQMCVI